MAMTQKPAVGGYFEWELREGRAFHEEKLALNSGRNALKYILQARHHTKLFLPKYLCEAVMQPVLELKIPHGFYAIDERLEPVGLDDGDTDSTVLYINYFGLKGRAVHSLAKNTKNLIVDNTQAFFSLAPHRVPTFYSARKFFGVPDGAYVSGCDLVAADMETDQSYERCAHLLKRLDLDAEAGFSAYQKNEEVIAMLPMRKMSRLTSSILSSINYVEVADRRRKNYKALHALLSKHNRAIFTDVDFTDIDNDCVPMVYPFLCDRPSVRAVLLRNRVYCAQLWPNVLTDLSDQPDSVEYQMAANIIPLPVDQRYDEKQMDVIASIIIGALNNG